MSETHHDQEFLHFVLSSILDDTESLQIDRKVDDLGVLLTVTVADSDMGKIIGKGGQTIQALRVLLRLVGAKTNERINLKVVDPQQSEMQ